MDAIAARQQRIDSSKLHASRWDGFPRPSWGFNAASANSLHVTNIPTAAPPARTPSPMLSDTSHSFTGPVSPLPSPLLTPQLDLEPPATPGTKTKAFFGSSWKSLIPKPATPPKLKRHSASSTDNPDGPRPRSPAPVDIPTSNGRRDSGEDQQAPITPPPLQSQTNSFFNTPSKYVPSPPPSIRHFSPDEKPESVAAALRLHLARLSPARVQPMIVTEDSPDSLAHDGSHSRSSSHSSSGHGHGYGGVYNKPPRDFVYWTPESSDLSRSSSRSSVSGIRRDFAFTPLNPSSSYSPSTHTSSPFTRLRELDEATVPTSPSELLTPRPNDVIPDSGTPRDHTGPMSSSGPAPPCPSPQAHALVRRETQRNPSECHLQAGMTIGDEAPLVLVRLLGQGAFSSVWLARDVEDRLIPPGPRQRRRKSVSTARKEGDAAAVPGLRPAATQPPTRLGVLNELDGEGAILPSTIHASRRGRPMEAPSKVGKLVAVKMLDRTLCDVNDRTRISFVREVEVLRHISHPSIVAFLHAFTVSAYHCVVLEHIGGGELFELINSDENHARMTTPVLRRMWGELCRAVGWLHGVAIVHRDIKLENILLTVNPFLQSEPIELDMLPQPLIKLTDFGLARFIETKQPMLTTRCGSECYAAPELVLGQPYDGRQTDAWACGIVLYALAVRSLPFDAPSSERTSTGGGGGSRRKYLVRIAKCEYSWPSPESEEARLATDDLKSVVSRLLVRDPSKRAAIRDLWDEPFMRAVGAPSPPWRIAARRAVEEEEAGLSPRNGDEDEFDEDGMLVDAHDIDSIASQELL
ncbi:hypothetical protein M408DRAFT_329021 [Serendipita vermifera MAFF 305830]|uniref:Protein kinase domain-containing protein n=1 Tax=Serendipita vermifera MAFF 305830 TaxID=933852 RepID=A0A0C2WS41_SERVB|nr:hypothetical protein M408DRAFT_329021 [Serendipita vermifera MAFF 305830]